MLSRYAGITLSRSRLCIFNVYIRWSWLLPSLNLRPWTVCVHQILDPLKVSTTLSPPVVDPHNSQQFGYLWMLESSRGSSKFYIYLWMFRSSTVQGFWIFYLWMLKSGKGNRFHKYKMLTVTSPNFKHTIHFTLQFGIPIFCCNPRNCILSTS